MFKNALSISSSGLLQADDIIIIIKLHLILLWILTINITWLYMSITITVTSVSGTSNHRTLLFLKECA